MKKTFTLVTLTLLTIASTTLHAQLYKGSLALGGNLGFSSNTYKNDALTQTQRYVYVSPSLISFYKDNLAMGFNLNYNHSKQNQSGKSNTYGAGIFLRQYKTLGKGFYIFVQEALNYNYTKSDFDTSILTSYLNITSNDVGATVNPGIAYDLSKKFQLEMLFFNNLLSAYYSHSKYTNTASGTGSIQKYDSFSLGANLTSSQLTTLNVGAKIFFGR